MKIAKLFFGLACMAAFAACTNDDELLTNEVGQPHAMSFTLATGADTRTALAEPTDKTGTYSLTRTWKDGDAVEVCYSTDGSTMTHETFTLTAGAGTTSGTFSNDASNIPTTGEVKLNIITKAGSIFYYSDEGFVTIFNQGDGSIATVGNYEIIVWYDVAVTDGVWNFPEPVVMTSILHLPAGFPVYEAASSDVEATADLVLFTYGDNSDFAFTFPDGPLAVSVNIVEDNKLSLTGIKLKGGQLATDVYMAVFPGAVDSNISLNFTVIEEGEKGKEYTVKLKDPTSWLEVGNVYHLDAADIDKSIATPEVGMVIGSDGMYYATASDVPEGVTAEAMIAYLGTEAEGATHGLAIALQDASSSDGATWANAASTVSKWADDHEVTGGTWRLPSAYDWQRMFIGCGSTSTYVSALTNENNDKKFSYGNFRTKLKAAGGESADVQPDTYWSATAIDSDVAWGYYFDSGKFFSLYKRGWFHIRAALAF